MPPYESPPCKDCRYWRAPDEYEVPEEIGVLYGECWRYLPKVFLELIAGRLLPGN